jgi:hypothetical protein
MGNESWHTEALRRFPGLTETLREADTPYMVWIDLWMAFADAYDHEDQALIAGIYLYGGGAANNVRVRLPRTISRLA